MSLQLPLITSNRLLLRIAVLEDIPQIIKYFTINRAYLTPFSPTWIDGFFTDEYWQIHIEKCQFDFTNDYSLKLFIYPQINPKEIIGAVNFSSFVRGAANFCNVGYNLAADAQGQGYMTEALKIASEYVFQKLNFHRIMANYMPHNRRSGNVLKRLNFVVEGYARDYLLINGKWEDHILTSLTNYNWKP